jgi:hypothetical protein
MFNLMIAFLLFCAVAVSVSVVLWSCAAWLGRQARR